MIPNYKNEDDQGHDYVHVKEGPFQIQEVLVALSNMDSSKSFVESPTRLGVVLIVTGVFLYSAFRILYRRFPCPLPPSPPAEPILGHFRRLPTENAHFKHMEYAKQYGE